MPIICPGQSYRQMGHGILAAFARGSVQSEYEPGAGGGDEYLRSTAPWRPAFTVAAIPVLAGGRRRRSKQLRVIPAGVPLLCGRGHTEERWR